MKNIHLIKVLNCQLNLTDKTNLKRSDKYVALSNHGIYCTWKNIKSYTKAVNLKYQLQRGAKVLIYPMDHIMYQIFKIILIILSKRWNSD